MAVEPTGHMPGRRRAPPLLPDGVVADAAGGRGLARPRCSPATATTRTVTVVMEPVPLARAAAAANRQLTSIEADPPQKETHGFRLTARERRRQADVEARERELAEGHPEFRHVGIVTVTAADRRRAGRGLRRGWSRPPPSRCSTCARWPPAKAQGGWRRCRWAGRSGRGGR